MCKKLNLENKHAAVSERCCHEMAKKYKWELIEIRELNNPILKRECVFRGEQTTFEVEDGTY